jgi:hypothetical protein
MQDVAGAFGLGQQSGNRSRRTGLGGDDGEVGGFERIERVLGMLFELSVRMGKLVWHVGLLFGFAAGALRALLCLLFLALLEMTLELREAERVENAVLGTAPCRPAWPCGRRVRAALGNFRGGKGRHMLWVGCFSTSANRSVRVGFPKA